MKRAMKNISFKSKAVISGLLDYLGQKGEENLLPEVSKSLEKEVDKLSGQDEIIVTSTVRLTSSQLAKIKSSIYKMLKKKLPVKNEINQKLLGGFTVRVNDWFFDSSISRQVELLKQSLLT